MPKNCAQTEPGGKGNLGLFIERDPKVCAAGMPSAQRGQTVAACLKYYSLKDEVDALISDTIKPEPKPRMLPPLRHKPLLDMRNAGPFSEARNLINPPAQSKYQSLIADLKNTVYSSYWKKEVGTGSDQVPNLPEGFNLENRFGIKTQGHGRFYDDVLMPRNPVPHKTPAANEVGYQKNRNYCKSSFNSNTLFGKGGTVKPGVEWVKCAMTDERINLGLVNKQINYQQADFRKIKLPPLGKPLTPNDNIKSVPLGFTFGIITRASDENSGLIASCEINPEKGTIKKCLAHLNTLRKFVKKRFDQTFFRNFYLKIKHVDKDKTGWLPKQLVYEFCFNSYIRFEPSLLEPLLKLWNIFDGTQVEYKAFISVINYAVPTPEMPKIWDVPDDYIDFRTTYSEMVEPDQEPGNYFMAGLPSGRYFDKDNPVTPDGYCKADRTYLPHESNVMCCLCPSVFTLLGVSHRDMYKKRTSAVVRKVFEAAGEKFTDEQFETIWNNAKKYHSQEWVCFETFRKAFMEVNIGIKNNELV